MSETFRNFNILNNNNNLWSWNFVALMNKLNCFVKQTFDLLLTFYEFTFLVEPETTWKEKKLFYF